MPQRRIARHVFYHDAHNVPGKGSRVDTVESSNRSEAFGDAGHFEEGYVWINHRIVVLQSSM